MRFFKATDEIVLVDKFAVDVQRPRLRAEWFKSQSDKEQARLSGCL
jgi:hypothetical protein